MSIGARRITSSAPLKIKPAPMDRFFGDFLNFAKTQACEGALYAGHAKQKGKQWGPSGGSNNKQRTRKWLHCKRARGVAG